MYELFNQIDGVYKLPNGSTATSKDLKDSGNYNTLFNEPCAIEANKNVLKSYVTLSYLADTYGVIYEDEESPEDILDKINNIIEMQKLSPSFTFTDVIAKAATFAALTFTDEQALEVPDLYPVYEVDHAYKKDERFTYNGRLFKVNQDHTSAAQWVPGETGTESLYTNLEMAGDGYLVWTQPTGAHNAYNTGDIVHYPTADDPLYKSLIDGNSWSPDAYPAGWELYTGGESSDTETPTEPSTDPSEGDDEPETNYPDFVQPTGAHDAYNIGDIVKFNGQLYKSTINNNVWSPDTYPQGWEIYNEA